jgi:hypothetical protein
LIAIATIPSCNKREVDASPPPKWQTSVDLKIGVTTGDTAYVFRGITSVIRTSDGNIVAADNNRLKFYDQTGKFIRSTGGTGGGPGEFSYLSQVRLMAGDSIYAYDLDRSLGAVFTPSGKFVRNSPRHRPSKANLSSTSSRDQSVSTVQDLPNGMSLLRLYKPTKPEEPVELFLWDGNRGSKAISLGNYPGESLRMVIWKGKPAAGYVPFAAETAVAYNGDYIFVGNGANPFIKQIAFEDLAVNVIKLGMKPERVTKRDIEEVQAYTLAQAKTPLKKAAAENFFDYVEVPKTKPAFSRILIDATGDLWLSDYYYKRTARGRFPELPVAWTVVNAEGKRLARVVLPARFSPSMITGDRIIGVSVDDDDITSILVLKVDRLSTAL